MSGPGDPGGRESARQLGAGGSDEGPARHPGKARARKGAGQLRGSSVRLLRRPVVRHLEAEVLDAGAAVRLGEGAGGGAVVGEAGGDGDDGALLAVLERLLHEEQERLVGHGWGVFGEGGGGGGASRRSFRRRREGGAG